MEEINDPGTSVFKAFQRIQQASLLRAAMECNHLGFKRFNIISTRNITTQRERNRVSGNARETDFTMAPGQYSQEIDLGIQITAQLFNDSVPEASTSDIYDATKLLIAFGLAEPVSKGSEGGDD